MRAALLAALAALLAAGAARGFDFDELPLPEIFETGGQPEGIRVDDMLFDAGSLLTEPAASGGAQVFAFVPQGSEAWPDGVVPVSFSKSVSAERRRLFFEVCAEWSKVAKVRCAPRRKEWGYVQVEQPAEGCNAWVGYSWRRRTVNLADGCWTRGVVLHELGHVLGLTHEHQRHDRDKHIQVRLENVEPEHKDAYALLRAGRMYTKNYDFASAMHYSPWTFAKPGLRAFDGRPGFEQAALSAGLKDRPSPGDAAVMATLYGAPKRRAP